MSKVNQYTAYVYFETSAGFPIRAETPEEAVELALEEIDKETSEHSVDKQKEMLDYSHTEIWDDQGNLVLTSRL